MAEMPHLCWVACHQEGTYDFPLWSLRMSYRRVINHSERGSPGFVPCGWESREPSPSSLSHGDLEMMVTAV